LIWVQGNRTQLERKLKETLGLPYEVWSKAVRSFRPCYMQTDIKLTRWCWIFFSKINWN